MVMVIGGSQRFNRAARRLFETECRDDTAHTDDPARLAMRVARKRRKKEGYEGQEKVPQREEDAIVNFVCKRRVLVCSMQHVRWVSSPAAAVCTHADTAQEASMLLPNR